MHLSSLHIYPIKSARGISLASAALDDFGLEGDRRWMVIDPSGRFVSQREAHRLALLEVDLDTTELILDAPGMSPLRLPRALADGRIAAVRIWEDTCEAIEGSAEAERWLTTFLGTPARLAYMPDQTFRVVNQRYVPDRRRVSFADAYPALLTGESSLADLNGRMASPLPMNRFRPNLVVRGSEPFEEDRWKTVRIGAVEFDVVKPCDRCVTTTIDQATGEQGREPLRTLATFRKWDGQVYFGQNVVHRTGGVLRSGDPVSPTLK